MNRFATELETKEISEAGDFYTVKGYASVFGNKDLDNDVIAKGAFSQSLKTRHPQFLWGHDMGSIPLGRITEIKEDSRGLYFEAEMPKDDERVKGQVAPQLRIGSIKGVSIGFRVKDRERQKDGTTLIKSAELFEVSLVNVPANPEAQVSNFKSLGVVPHEELLPLARRDRPWDAESALERVKEFTESNDEPTAAFKAAFLLVDGDSDDSSNYKFLIADVIDGRLTAIPAAIYKAATAIMHSKEADDIDASAREAIQDNLDRYYSRLELTSASKALSKVEWEALEAGERVARLRALGLSQGLAKSLSGHRAGRSPQSAGQDADLAKALRAIDNLAKGLKSNVRTA